MLRCVLGGTYKSNYLSPDMVYHSTRLESSSSSSYSKIIFMYFKLTLKFSTQFHTLFMVGSQCCWHKSPCNDICTVCMNMINSHFPNNKQYSNLLQVLPTLNSYRISMMISANIKENVTKQNCNIQFIFILIAVTNYWHDSNNQKSYFLFLQ